MHFEIDLDRLKAEVGLPNRPDTREPRSVAEQQLSDRSFVADILRKRTPSDSAQ